MIVTDKRKTGGAFPPVYQATFTPQPKVTQFRFFLKSDFSCVVVRISKYIRFECDLMCELQATLSVPHAQ